MCLFSVFVYTCGVFMAFSSIVNTVIASVMAFSPMVVSGGPAVDDGMVPTSGTRTSFSTSAFNNAFRDWNTLYNKSVKKKNNYRIVVNQGDMTNKGCTISYVDNARGKAYTAAHCSGGVGQVFVNRKGQPIGVHTAGERVNDPAVSSDRFVDTAELTLFDGVGGRNLYTNDRVLSWSDISAQDTVCFTGQHTAGRVKCGKVSLMMPYRIRIHGTPGNGAQPGDSGGPAWIPGRGYIGVVTAGNATDTAINVVNSPTNVFTR